MSSFAEARKWEELLWPVIAQLCFLALWHFAVSLTATKVFPSPMAVERGLVELAGKGLLWTYIGGSLGRVAVGFSAAALIGIPVGLALGWYPAVNQIVNPVLQMLRPISPIAWIPVAILLFGIGNTTAVFLIFLAAFFPIVVACVSGVSSVGTNYRRAGRNFGLTDSQLLVKVVFPASLPQIIIGLRLALGIAWMVVVAAEMVAVDSGLGYLVIDARNSGKRYDLVVAAMLVIGLIGLVLDLCVRRLRKIKAVRWGFRDDS